MVHTKRTEVAGITLQDLPSSFHRSSAQDYAPSVQTLDICR